MKFFWLICLTSGKVFVDGKIQTILKIESNLITAVRETAVEMFSLFGESLNVITNQENFLLLDFKDELLAQMFNAEILIYQETASELSKSLKRRRQSVLMLIDSFMDFTFIYQEFKRELFRYNGYFLIVAVSEKILKIDEIFKLFWKIQVSKVVVLIKGYNDTVVAKTFMPFNKLSCQNSTPIIIDEFKDGKFLNEKKQFFMDSLKNLHKCPVTVTISDSIEPFVIIDTLSDGTLFLKGVDISLLNVMSEKFNFKINYTYIGDEGYLHENGSSVGPLRFVMDGKADLSISNWWLLEYRLKFIDATSPYNTDKVIFVVPPGGELTTFEKLIFPFTKIVWLMIIACFIVGLFVIFITKRHHKSTQDFVFGTGVSSPYLNMIVGFIGGSQNILPKRNFARFLLMSFLMYSMIIRTLYQGAFYHMMQSNKHHKEVQTVDEIIEEDYRFVLHKGDIDMFKGTEAIAKKATFIESAERSSNLDEIQTNSSFRGVLGISLFSVLYFNLVRLEENRFKICKEVVINAPVVIYARKNFYLVDAMNDLIENTKSAGLIDFWQFEYVDKDFLKIKKSSEPKVLTAWHLIGCFYVLFVGYLIGLLFFLNEIFIDKLKRSFEIKSFSFRRFYRKNHLKL